MSDKAKKQVQIHVKCDADLAEDFKRIADKEGYSQSLVIRELMKRFIEKNGQLDLFK